MLFQNREIPYALLEEMHKRKTAALISLALTSGAIIAKAKESEVATLREIGYRMGIAFQLVDDILDQEGHIEISRAKTEAARFLNDAERKAPYPLSPLSRFKCPFQKDVVSIVENDSHAFK